MKAYEVVHYLKYADNDLELVILRKEEYDRLKKLEEYSKALFERYRKLELASRR